MKTEVRARWGGVVALLSGAAFLTEGLLYLAGHETLQNVVLAIAYVFAAGGLAGFDALQRHRYGRAGRIGSALVMLGWATAFVGTVSGVEPVHVVGFLIALVGYLVYGVATLRARVLPRWLSITLIAVAPVSLLAGEYTTIALGLVWIGLASAALNSVARRTPIRQAALS